MDKTDEKILDILKSNARISFQELGDAIGMSRVAAKKRVKKLESEGVISGYRAEVHTKDEVIGLIDIVTTSGKYEEVLEFVLSLPKIVRIIYQTTLQDHIHIETSSDGIKELKELTDHIRKERGNDIIELRCHAVTGIFRDDFGGEYNE